MLFDSLTRKVDSKNIYSSGSIARICCFINDKAVNTAVGKIIGISLKASFEQLDQKIGMSWFIQVFSRIAILPTSMLMTTGSTESIAEADKSKLKVNNSRH